MSDTDLLFLYSEYLQAFYTTLGFLTTILFAYIVASFVTVHRLSWGQFSMLAILHFLLSSSLAASVANQAEMLSNYANEIATRISVEGSPIGFINPESLDPWAPIELLIFWVAATLISIGFAAKLKIDRR